jgi:phosphopantetheinyl transferase
MVFMRFNYLFLSPSLVSVNYLSCNEQIQYASLHDERYRLNWYTGRLAAKMLLSSMIVPRPAFSDLEIISTNGLGFGIRPLALCSGRALTYDISIAHSEGAALVAATHAGQSRIGVDLVHIPTMPTNHALDVWLTKEENNWLEADENINLQFRNAALWAGKEAIYKALNQGEGFAPAQISLQPKSKNRFSGSAWNRQCEISIQCIGNHVAAFAESNNYNG